MKNLLFFLCTPIFLLLWAHFPLYAQVNHDGSYSYSIPISIPPGVQGVQPQLSLSYNSNAKDGLLGLGWQLSSIPVITRKNWTNSIQYENSDTFWGRMVCSFLKAMVFIGLNEKTGESMNGMMTTKDIVR